MHRSRTTISCRLVAPILTAGLFAATGAAGREPDPPRPFQSFPTLIAWTTELPAGPIAAPVITSQHVVVPLQSGELVARRVTDGKPGWTQKLLAVAPIVVTEAVIVVPEARAVHGLNAATGESIWTVAVPDVAAPPIARGGWVILASSEGLRALRAADGVEVWSQPIVPVQHAPAIDGDGMYVSLADGHLLAVDLPSGTIRWKREIGADPSEPFAIGDRVSVGGGKYAWCIKASDGSVEWRFQIGAAVVGPPALDDRHVFFASMDNLLRAFRRGSGSQDWKQDLGYRPAGGPLVTATSVSVPGRTAALRAFDKETRRVVGQLKLPDPAVTAFGLRPPEENEPGKLAVVANALGKPWVLALAIEAPLPPPPLPLTPLSTLPGTALPNPKEPG